MHEEQIETRNKPYFSLPVGSPSLREKTGSDTLKGKEGELKKLRSEHMTEQVIR